MPKLTVAADFHGAERCDALVVVASSPLQQSTSRLPLPEPLLQALQAAFSVDQALASAPPAPVVLPSPHAPGGRVVLAATPALVDETDDVRLFAEATAAAINRAAQAGVRHPLLVVEVPADPRFSRAREVAALAALGTAWVSLEAREGRPADKLPGRCESVTVLGLSPERRAWVEAVEAGRVVCRDITTGGPERMAPLQVARYCQQAFQGTGVQVQVEEDVSGYPLLAAVARASARVERHRPCVVSLTLEPQGPVTRTLLVAGKGVTFDTGGADLKTDGGMAGMSRDKGGAAAAAGLVRTLAALRLPGLQVICLLGLVRNSIGEDSFVSDEIITARSGVRVQIGNTDAEGRLVLADLLAALKERAAEVPQPQLLSLATLTGHVYRAFGPYTGALENAASRAAGLVRSLAEAGEAFGEPLESTRPRREDYLFAAPKSPAEDVLSSNRLASVSTPRGHQGPYAFIDIASGLRRSGLPFLHLDISGVVVSPPDWQVGRPTGAPIAALAAMLSG